MDKDYRHIRYLLDRFYEGHTTPAEEEMLANFFRENSDLPEEFSPDKAAFDALDAGLKGTEVPAGLAEAIMNAIDSKESANDARNAEIPQDRKTKRSFAWKLTASISAAAAVACLIMLVPLASRLGNDLPDADRLASIADTTRESARQFASNTDPEIIGNDTAKVSDGNADRTDNTTVSSTATTGKTADTPGRKANVMKTSGNGTEELSQEEMEALRIGMAALAKAGRQMAYARDRVDETDKALENSINEVNNILNK